MFVQEANKYSSEIHVTYAGRTVNAKSILGVLTLGANKGADILISTQGKDAEEALEALKRLVVSNFGMEEKI
jgi:phosphotransferase system HPr (HPr) family protein